MYATTRDFIAALDRAGELARVRARVSPVLEITHLADRQSKSPAPNLPSERTRTTDPRFHHLGGKALLLENVEGSDFPVLINQFGSYRRVEMALGCHDAGHTPGGLEALAERLGKLVKPEPPPTLLAKLRKLPELLELAKLPPKRVGRGVCQEVVISGDAVDLRRLPLLRCWPLDADLAALGYPAGVNAGVPGVESGDEWERLYRGRYITLAGIHTIHRDDLGHPSPPSRNVGMYRVQLLGRRTLAMHWHMHHDGARHWRSWKARGERMPVAIALGGESVLPYAATAPMPPGISELLLAGFLNRGPIEMVRCRTVPLDVPANSEIVIEGWVSAEAGLPGWDPRDPRAGPLGPGAVFEGPFGDHTGFYSLPDRYPLLEVTAVTHRRDAVYPTTVVGPPPQEDYFLGKATERLFLPLLRTLIPDVADYDLPLFGAFHNCAVVKIRKEYPLQARRVMHAVWGAGQMAWTKTVIAVDEDVDVHDVTAVLRAVGERCRPGRDVCTVQGPLDILDHASPYLGAGTKIGLDATRKRPGEEAGGAAVDAAWTGAAPEGYVERVQGIAGVLDAAAPAALGGAWLFVKVDARLEGGRVVGSADVAAIAAALDGLGEARPAYTVLLGSGVDIHDLDAALFHWCANSDAGRDLLRREERLVIDATPKGPGTAADGRNGYPARSWPPILEMERRVVEDLRGRGLQA
jgi:4-hydroxy-3-polyprenylbenzoate decarboxylase